MAKFQKGHAKLGGKKKGTPNKVTKSVKEALEYAFQGLGGADALMQWAGKNPSDFFRLWVKMLPAEHKISLDLDDRFANEVRKRLDEIDSGDGGQPGQVGGTQPQSVVNAAAPAIGEPVPCSDGEGQTGPAVNPDAATTREESTP